MLYTLYDWPWIPGRGEFVRLALEWAGVGYDDAARAPSGPDPAPVEGVLADTATPQPALALPVLDAPDRRIGQTANILLFLGQRHALAPGDSVNRLWAHQLQLTIADGVGEVHDTHHPLDPSLYDEDQRDVAQRRAELLRNERLPKFLGYFERVLAANPNGPQWLVGDGPSYVDLSLMQMVAGLRHAFPNAMAQLEPEHPGVGDLVARVGELERVAAYLASDRRPSFNNDGLFRHYPELDAGP